jgi:hypothetical protein
MDSVTTLKVPKTDPNDKRVSFLGGTADVRKPIVEQHIAGHTESVLEK